MVYLSVSNGLGKIKHGLLLSLFFIYLLLLPFEMWQSGKEKLTTGTLSALVTPSSVAEKRTHFPVTLRVYPGQDIDYISN